MWRANETGPFHGPLIAAQPPAPRDVFLIGSAFSGSTHLGNLIAANFDATYVGEIARLPLFVDAYRLSDDPIGCLLCAGDGDPCPVWTPDVVEAVEQAGPGAHMTVLRNVTGSSMVVDGSKAPGWLRLSAERRPSAAAPMMVVVVTRSPLSFALTASVAMTAPVWQVAQWWRDVYIDSFRTANRLQLPLVVVRNEEVRQSPQRVLERMSALLAQDPRAALQSAAATHSIGGNIWVQKGYSARTRELHDTLGLGRVSGMWREELVDEVARNASITKMVRPRTRGEATAFSQAVVDCPGLCDLAQTLGYEMSTEISAFLADIDEETTDLDEEAAAVELAALTTKTV